jgi:hypothetical protein
MAEAKKLNFHKNGNSSEPEILAETAYDLYALIPAFSDINT